jgi:hypothetical protein
MVFTPSRAAVAVRPKGAVKEVTHQLQCFIMLKKSSNYMSSSAAKRGLKVLHKSTLVFMQKLCTLSAVRRLAKPTRSVVIYLFTGYRYISFSAFIFNRSTLGDLVPTLPVIYLH